MSREEIQRSELKPHNIERRPFTQLPLGLGETNNHVYPKKGDLQKERETVYAMALNRLGTFKF